MLVSSVHIKPCIDECLFDYLWYMAPSCQSSRVPAQRLAEEIAVHVFCVGNIFLKIFICPPVRKINNRGGSCREKSAAYYRLWYGMVRAPYASLAVGYGDWYHTRLVCENSLRTQRDYKIGDQICVLSQYTAS